jgi:alanine racemase
VKRGAGDTGTGGRLVAWAEIDLGALRRNFARARTLARGRRVVPVVKADAYGHGAARVAGTLARAGADALAVAMLDEALELRALGLELPLLLMQGLRSSHEADLAVAQRTTLTVSHAAQLDWLDAAAARAGHRVGVHLKLDTGMGRLGFALEDLDAVLDRLSRAAQLDLEGVMTQLAESESPTSPATVAQRTRFAAAVARVRERGFTPAWIHADPSGGLLGGPTDVATAVRPGLLLYGGDPRPAPERDAGLEPVMHLRCRVIQCRDVPAGARVGYGGTWSAPRPTRILTLPIGYADGLARAAGGRWTVLVDGVPAPIVGRVSMDLAAVDVGPDAKSGLGSEVLIFGGRGAQRLHVEDLADALGSIAHEVLTGIGPRVQRVVCG